jgi:hypothetical protein
MFIGTIACAVRAVPNGSNDTATFQSRKGQNIQHWIMLVPMPVEIDLIEFQGWYYLLHFFYGFSC